MKSKAPRGRIVLYYDEQGEIQIKATGQLKKQLEEELAAKAEADKQARIDARNAEVAGFEERYRKSPAHAPVSENASPAASDADKDQSIRYQDNGHGVVIASSPLLRGESPKHTDTNM